MSWASKVKLSQSRRKTILKTVSTISGFTKTANHSDRSSNSLNNDSKHDQSAPHCQVLAKVLEPKIVGLESEFQRFLKLDKLVHEQSFKTPLQLIKFAASKNTDIEIVNPAA